MATHQALRASPSASPSEHRLSVEEYLRFRAEGYLVVPRLLDDAAVAALRAHGERLQGSPGGDPENGIPAPPPDQSWFPMLHRRVALHERVALHRGIVGIVAGLAGPDVMLMQTMLFLKPPGERGNGWHQDSWYLQTCPDSLCGAWVALDDCDEENGALVVAVGSQVEPIHSHARQPHPDRALLGMREMDHLHDPDDARNELAPIAARYPRTVVAARAGDVVFLHGHVLHSSLPNLSRVRRRRAFVAHYANARAFTAWGSQYPAGHPQHAPADPALHGMTNGAMVLAHGATQLPIGRPRFAAV
jgi:ectoine hydroxylase-related dioxygenase (phytanoyl-CoA dioxygenase family)